VCYVVNICGDQTHRDIRIGKIDYNDTTGNMIMISHADDETVWYYSEVLFPTRPIWRHNTRRDNLDEGDEGDKVQSHIILSNECIQTHKLNKYGVPDDEFELW